MSNITHGMDVASIRQMANALQTQADKLDFIRDSVEQLVSNASNWWSGPDMTSFGSQWQSKTRVQLFDLSNLLSSFADLAKRNADAQESTSSTLDSDGSLLFGHSKGSLLYGHSNGPLAKNALGFPFRIKQPANSVQEVLDRIDIAEAAYAGNEGFVPKDWRILNSEELRLLGISESDLHDPHTGFDADIYMRPDGGLTVSFRGTEDLLTPGGILGLGGVPLFNKDTYANSQRKSISLQDQKTMILVHKLHNNMVAAGLDPTNMDFVGHSLGGRHALIAGIMTGREALALNPSHVQEEAYNWAVNNRVKGATRLVQDDGSQNLFILKMNTDPANRATKSAIPKKFVNEVTFKHEVDPPNANPYFLWEGHKTIPHDISTNIVSVKSHDIDKIREAYRSAVEKNGHEESLREADAARSSRTTGW